MWGFSTQVEPTTHNVWRTVRKKRQRLWVDWFMPSRSLHLTTGERVFCLSALGFLFCVFLPYCCSFHLVWPRLLPRLLLLWRICVLLLITREIALTCTLSIVKLFGTLRVPWFFLICKNLMFLFFSCIYHLLRWLSKLILIPSSYHIAMVDNILMMISWN